MRVPAGAAALPVTFRLRAPGNPSPRRTPSPRIFPLVVLGLTLLLENGCAWISRHEYFAPGVAPSAVPDRAVTVASGRAITGGLNCVTLRDEDVAVEVHVCNYRSRPWFGGPVPLPIVPLFPITLFMDPPYSIDRYDLEPFSELSDSTLTVHLSVVRTADWRDSVNVHTERVTISTEAGSIPPDSVLANVAGEHGWARFDPVPHPTVRFRPVSSDSTEYMPRRYACCGADTPEHPVAPAYSVYLNYPVDPAVRALSLNIDGIETPSGWAEFPGLSFTKKSSWYAEAEL